MSDLEHTAEPACSSSPPATQTWDATPINYAFLVHSQKTLTQNLPPRVDNKLLARQKRRRTSPEDHAILEAEYQRNPKPDKTARASIVTRVSLGEKEVQIWFQNRRQNDRRKSKPLQPHELLAPRTSASDASKHAPSDDSLPSEMVPSSSPEQPEEIGQETVPSTQSSDNSCESDEALEDKGGLEQPAFSSQTSLATSVALESSQPVSKEAIVEPESAQTQEVPTYDESQQNMVKRKRSVTEVQCDKPFVQGASTPSQFHDIKSPPSLRLSLSFDGEAMVRKEGEFTPSPPKGRNALRIAMSSDGKAVIRADGEPSPSRNRISMFSARKPPFTGLRRSSSAVAFSTPRAGSTDAERMFGRSRDPRNWEAFFDTDARSALSTPMSSQSAPGAGSPGLFRSRSQRSLTRSLSAKHNMSLPMNSADYLNTPVPKPNSEKRRRISRTASSLGRLESDHKLSYAGSNLKAYMEAAKDGDVDLQCGDSDKENWIPGTRVSHNRRRVASHHNPRRSGHKPRVAVIGAGFAGLRCADILLQNNAQVVLFEARDRLGGRVHQSKIHDHLVDMGPNWIHGTGKNPIVSIAEATSTAVEDFEGNQALIAPDGTPISDDVAQRISDVLWTIIAKAFEYSNTYKGTIPADRSLLDYIKEQVAQTDLSEEEKELCVESSKMWGAYVGDPIERQSLKYFCLEECIDGNNYFVASTYTRILEHVSKTARQHADIRLNQPIIKIESSIRDDSSSSTTTTTTSSSSTQVTLTTASGETSTYDEVVVTCPLGWLKRNKDAFTPSIPPRLSQAIDSISYGRLEKVYITFPRAFWHTPPASSSPSPSTSTSTITNPTPNPTYKSYQTPTFAQFLNPSYSTTHPAEIHWNQECISLAALSSRETAHPTLLFYTFGPSATYIVSLIAHLAPTSPEYFEELHKIFHPFFARLHNYTPTAPECQPLAYLATTWQTDPYAGHGSYCNFQVGLQRGDQDIEVLRAGMGADRGVWFAGEHTAPFVALGTTTGAYWSGERAAAGICALYGLGTVGLGVRGMRDDSLPSAGA
ncbi:FAD/NAD(P)-binding domain-containing protein [Aspergillus uvarum CBS 121591]|uniref:FAD/NAD(P)-binding domain-containing protein n=1 Tax=Aspergillus uvarum CBS 121591 TaxID=1448315 RepID=A0A319CC74_9EURO|nr:FAD/NAD(P)-binding domain-containing protein [Aspergillus uvarum CBS 121591]PYH82774.1 FAD/NAD(P)-binding domain-containing protein [Aspergillus uvarum CBS 121591]